MAAAVKEFWSAVAEGGAVELDLPGVGKIQVHIGLNATEQLVVGGYMVYLIRIYIYIYYRVYIPYLLLHTVCIRRIHICITCRL